MKTILCFMALNSRPDVSQLALDGFLRLQKAWRGRVILRGVFLCDNIHDRRLAETYGLVIDTPAKPVGLKFNTGLNEVMKGGTQFDYLLQLGDDDVLSPNALDHYEDIFDRNIDVAGFQKILFYDAATVRFLEYVYSHIQVRMLGAGRVINREAIERAAYRIKAKVVEPWNRKRKGHYYHFSATEFEKNKHRLTDVHEPVYSLWNNDQERSLDYVAEQRLLEAGAKLEIIDVQKPLVVDIKAERNIWGFSHYNAAASPYKKDVDQKALEFIAGKSLTRKILAI